MYAKRKCLISQLVNYLINVVEYFVQTFNYPLIFCSCYQYLYAHIFTYSHSSIQFILLLLFHCRKKLISSL